MRNPRGIETGLARFTLVSLVLYFPLETWVSLPYGLWRPFYLVDFIAMLLLFFGARRSLSTRPARSPDLLCVAWAWTACNGWRGTFWRVFDVLENDGTRLDHGMLEMWVVASASFVALICFIIALVLLLQKEGR